MSSIRYRAFGRSIKIFLIGFSFLDVQAEKPMGHHMSSSKPLKIAVVGSGISGLSCAWLLSQQHTVTLFEKDDRLGGHSNTVGVDHAGRRIPVDTGFIVYNPINYPNLVALFDHLNVPTVTTDMSFGVSVNQGDLEYSGSGLSGLFAQKSNLFSPRFLGMVRDILRFYRSVSEPGFDPATLTLRELLQKGGYGQAFCDEHLLPMGAAIWSTPVDKMLDYPAAAFLNFCQNHGLLQVKDRPQWHTVKGGSREYVQRLNAAIKGTVLTNRAVRQVRRMGGKVLLQDWQGEHWQFDHIVFACHADQTAKLLSDIRTEEDQVLRHFRFERNRALLHSDIALMPKRKQVWSSWNYLSDRTDQQHQLCVSYWMNRLQPLGTEHPFIVTLNPIREPAPGSVHASFLYDHPVFDEAALRAQKNLWDIQGQHNTWYCGAWCGYGFHEDGLQSGLIVAEALGGVQRPWLVENANSRIPLPAHWPERAPLREVAA